jgi:hypothetical protein
MSKRFMFRALHEEQMRTIGDDVAAGIKLRTAKGINANDMPAKPLNKNYARAKQRRGLNPIRDLQWRGMTMRSMRVVSASDNKVAIGFDNPQASRIAAFNNKHDPAFWFSPNDEKVIQESVAIRLREGQNLKAGSV